jgi:hypothetical protein
MADRRNIYTELEMARTGDEETTVGAIVDA